MNRVLSVAAVAAALSLAPASALAQQEPSREQLQQELADLKARIAALEAKQQQDATLAADQQTKQDVITDAEKRSKLGGGGSPVTAGYDKGFFIKSEDGNFSLRPGVQVQFRYVSNFGDDTDGDDTVDDGFELRRTRWRSDGNVLSPDLTYSFVFDANRSGGNVTLLDAWAAYKFDPKWSVKVGQFKESVFHEKDVTFASMLAVERSLVDAVLGGNTTDRVQGVALIYGGGKDDDVRAEFALHDGANSKNTTFQDTDAGDFGLGARGEWKRGGDWANYRDFTAKGTKENLLVLGAGADYTQAANSDIVRTTIDAQWENTSGLGLYGAAHGNFIDDDAVHAFDWGLLAQAGYLLNKKVEIFGRYDILKLDQVAPGNEDTFNEFTIGANYFLGPDGAYLHRAKFTVDVVYLPDGAPSTQTGLGVFGGDEDQVVLRGQFQLQL